MGIVMCVAERSGIVSIEELEQELPDKVSNERQPPLSLFQEAAWTPCCLQ